jgi:ADP-heptose:LPS heptosyltransferase
MEKIAFFHMNQLGDLLFSLPTLEAARRRKPSAQIVSIVRPELAPIVAASGLVDRVIPKQRGAAETLWRVNALRGEHFSHALLFSESPESLITAFCAGVPERYGFATASLSFLLTHKAGRAGVPSLLNNRNLAARFGFNDLATDYTGLVKVPLRESSLIEQWMVSEKIEPSRLVVLAPGASKRRRDKCWPETSWSVLVRLMQDKGLVPVMCGSPSEREALECLSEKGSPRPTVFTAPDGILSFAALLARARLFVGVDSGAMHLAASLKVPVIALFGATDPQQIGPMPLNRHTVIRKQQIKQISPEEVFSEVVAQVTQAA